MFSCLKCVDLSSRVGQQLGFVQHIAAVALVQAVRTQPGYQVGHMGGGVDICLKEAIFFGLHLAFCYLMK